MGNKTYIKGLPLKGNPFFMKGGELMMRQYKDRWAFLICLFVLFSYLMVSLHLSIEPNHHCEEVTCVVCSLTKDKMESSLPPNPLLRVTLLIVYFLLMKGAIDNQFIKVFTPITLKVKMLN